MKIDVTAKDIARGEPLNGCNCPIALALRRVTGKVWRVVNHVAWREEDDRRTTIRLPHECLVFQQRFDFPGRREPLQPFSFEVELSQPVSKYTPPEVEL